MSADSQAKQISVAAAKPTPPPTALPCTAPIVIFGHFRSALITLAKPIKKVFPSASVVMATISLKLAPAQKARSDPLFKIITWIWSSPAAASTIRHNSESKDGESALCGGLKNSM